MLISQNYNELLWVTSHFIYNKEKLEQKQILTRTRSYKKISVSLRYDEIQAFRVFKTLIANAYTGIAGLRKFTLQISVQDRVRVFGIFSMSKI